MNIDHILSFTVIETPSSHMARSAAKLASLARLAAW